MPPLSRLMIKVGLVWLTSGMVLGVAVAAARSGHLPPALIVLGPTWVHLITMGWLTQLIFGVAVWLFPRQSREEPLGRLSIAWFTFGAINAGLLLRLVGEGAIGLGVSGIGWAMVSSGVMQLAGVIAFTLYIWPRVRGK